MHSFDMHTHMYADNTPKSNEYEELSQLLKSWNVSELLPYLQGKQKQKTNEKNFANVRLLYSHSLIRKHKFRRGNQYAGAADAEASSYERAAT